jgi:hypothetical protein
MRLFILLLCLIGFLNVNSQSNSNDLYETAIKNILLDFSKTKIYKKGKVFDLKISYLDNELIYISFLENEENKYLYSISKPIEDNILPSSYIEKDGKLFIWWDKTLKVSQDMFDILKKYNMLKDDDGGWIAILDPIMDDNKKGVNYFICKNDFKIYKRIITNKGSIETPKLKCPCNDNQIHTHPNKKD